MKPLEEFLKLSPELRQARIGTLGMQEAIRALGAEAGIAWLEANIESPVTGAWGAHLYRLNAPWCVLDRWIHRSKQHCLAAVDALYLATDPHGDTRGKVPDGANPQLINDALDYALEKHRNPRLEKAAAAIREAWPRGGRKQRAVRIPDALLDAADILLGHDGELKTAWKESFANAKRVPRSASGLWESLRGPDTTPANA